MEKKVQMNKAKILIEEKCQESIQESLLKMELNERMLFVKSNEKFFSFQESDING